MEAVLHMDFVNRQFLQYFPILLIEWVFRAVNMFIVIVLLSSDFTFSSFLFDLIDFGVEHRHDTAIIVIKLVNYAYTLHHLQG